MARKSSEPASVSMISGDWAWAMAVNRKIVRKNFIPEIALYDKPPGLSPTSRRLAQQLSCLGRQRLGVNHNARFRRPKDFIQDLISRQLAFQIIHAFGADDEAAAVVLSHVAFGAQIPQREK